MRGLAPACVCCVSVCCCVCLYDFPVLRYIFVRERNEQGFAFTKAMFYLGVGAAKVAFNLIDLRKANNAGMIEKKKPNKEKQPYSQKYLKRG